MPKYRDIQRLADREQAAPHIQKALTSPNPTLGWKGDPDLVLAFNRLESRWEIFREEAWYDHATRAYHTIHRIIARSPRGERLDINQMIRGLVARDATIAENAPKKAMERYVQSVEQEEVDRTRRAEEAIRPVHERLAWTTAKETGNLAKYVSFG